MVVNQSEERGGRSFPALDEPERNELRQHPRRLRRAHAGQAGDGPQVEVRGRFGQDRENAALDARYHRFHGAPKVHTDIVALISH